MMPAGMEIRWPREFHPARAPVHVRNELRMDVHPDIVWAWMIRAARWPEWYPNSDNVRFLHPPGPDLQAGTVFRWKTFGVNLTSEVQEFVPGERLAWNARGVGVRAYHAWLVQRTDDGGCHVLTEETQHGWLCRLSQRVFPHRMSKFHQIWLERLQEMARHGLPG
jgi:Polyketide cyclase / dehydrase and lipid transport